MKKLLVIVSICLCFAGRANAQWVVSDPGNLAQSIINSAKEMVETAGTKANTLNGFLETQKIFQQSKPDPNFTADELAAISSGYAMLLDESSDVLQDLKNVVNVTGMSLSDAERLAVIDRAYNSLMNYRNLVNYYTRKNISVSYLRAKKKNDTDRVLALYGSADERYW